MLLSNPPPLAHPTTRATRLATHPDPAREAAPAPVPFDARGNRVRTGPDAGSDHRSATSRSRPLPCHVAERRCPPDPRRHRQPAPSLLRVVPPEFGLPP